MGLNVVGENVDEDTAGSNLVGENVDDDTAGDLNPVENAGIGGHASMYMHALQAFSKRGDPSNMVLTKVLSRGHSLVQTPVNPRSHCTVQSLCAQPLYAGK